MRTVNSCERVPDASERLRDRLRMGFLAREVIQNRYLDVGDWGKGYVAVVPHDDARSEAAVLIHEIAEYLLCLYSGVSAEDVDRDDARILKGKLRKQRSCYWNQHLAALRIERIFCKAMGLDWNLHGQYVNKAFRKQEALLSGGKKMGGKMKGKAFAKLKMSKKDPKAIKAK